MPYIVRSDLVDLIETLKLAFDAVLKFSAQLPVEIVWLWVLEAAFEGDCLSILLIHIP